VNASDSIIHNNAFNISWLLLMIYLWGLAVQKRFADAKNRGNYAPPVGLLSSGPSSCDYCGERKWAFAGLQTRTKPGAKQLVEPFNLLSAHW
jgi:hypothetical protein